MFLVDREAEPPKPKPDVVDPVLFLEESARRPDLGAGAFGIEHHAAAVRLLVLDDVRQKPLAPPAPDLVHRHAGLRENRIDLSLAFPVRPDRIFGRHKSPTPNADFQDSRA